MLDTISPTPQQWDEFVIHQPRSHVLQRAPWGILKSEFGWSVTRIALADEATLVAGAQILLKDLPFRFGKMAYLPMGPYAYSDEQLDLLWEAIDAQLKQEGVAFLKWEPGIFEGGVPHLDRWGFRETSRTVQPPNTILLDISHSEDDILANMSQNTRRKVRLSERKGIRYYHGTLDDIEVFTHLMNTTGERNEFGVHDTHYYRRAYELFSADHTATLIMAEHEGTPLAGVMAFHQNHTAWYLYGASSNEKRNLMASYGVQWEAIKWAKQHGCDVYDLWGIPDEVETSLEAQFQDRSDGLWGVYGFKRGFGGEIVRSAGAWDKVYKPLIYTAYRAAMQFRA